MTDQELIYRFVEDPAGLDEAELEQLIAHLRAEPAKAVELRQQLIIDDLLGQKLAVDRKNFIIMVQQRLADFERGEEEVYNQVADLRAIAEAEIERKVRPPGINPWVKFAGGISLLVFAVLCVVVWRYRESAPRAVANVVKLSGSVVRITGTTEEPLHLEQTLSTGDQIVVSAGSMIVWKYKDGTTISLLGESRTQLSADANLAKQVRLEQGELEADVSKQNIHRPMVFTTPHALATVRGTKLRLIVAEANTQLDVTEGKVDFQRHNNSNVLSLTAKQSGIATAVNIQTKDAQWPVNRAAAVFLSEEGEELVRNPESGNLRVASLDEDSEEAGKAVMSCLKQSDEFGCDIMFTSNKVEQKDLMLLCALGPLGNENFLLMQKGTQLFVQLRGASRSTPVLFELGEVTLGEPHYVSFAFQEGRVSAVVDGVEVPFDDKFPSSMATWEEGPLVLKADASGQRSWWGKIEAMVLFNQFIDKPLSDANRARHKQLHP